MATEDYISLTDNHKRYFVIARFTVVTLRRTSFGVDSLPLLIDESIHPVQLHVDIVW